MRGFAVAVSGRRPLSLSVLVVFSLLLIVGCGGRDYELAPVSGRITVNGEPLAAGMGVTFQPRGKTSEDLRPGPGSYGIADADGRYSLKTMVDLDEEGAVVGKHVVRLAIPEEMRGGDPESDDDMPRGRPAIVLPKRAQDGSVEFEVPSGGTDQANFDF